MRRAQIFFKAHPVFDKDELGVIHGCTVHPCGGFKLTFQGKQYGQYVIGNGHEGYIEGIKPALEALPDFKRYAEPTIRKMAADYYRQLRKQHKGDK